MTALVAHALHGLAEIALFAAIPVLYVAQRLVRRLIAKVRGKPWPPPARFPDGSSPRRPG